MAQDTSAGVRVTIWRAFAPDRTITFQTHEADAVTVVGPDFLFQREAFTWQPKEDIWGGLADADVRTRLSQRLQVEFEPALRPGERSLEKLGAYLNDVGPVLDGLEWATSSQQLENDGETPMRLNPLLSFYRQLEWIYQVFRDVPGASVSIR